VRVMTNATEALQTPLMQLIKSRNIAWVSPIITDELYPTADRMLNEFKEFRFHDRMSSEKVIQYMREKGYEPANIHELLCWGGWNGDSVVALGSLRKYRSMGVAPCLQGGTLPNELRLYLSDFPWDTSYSFLGVRKPNP